MSKNGKVEAKEKYEREIREAIEAIVRPKTRMARIDIGPRDSEGAELDEA